MKVLAIFYGSVEEVACRHMKLFVAMLQRSLLQERVIKTYGMGRNFVMKKYLGIDLFSGAGGLSLGAEMAGIEVAVAIESDLYAATTYKNNHKNTVMLNEDIKRITNLNIDREGAALVLFGGPPCQGFSTSNQRTRNKENPQNWLYKEFIRFAKEMQPDWIVFENVKGIKETAGGFFSKGIAKEISDLGYTCTSMILCASDYGIPQRRSRFFLVGSLHGEKVTIPKGDSPVVTVREAIEDLPSLINGANQDIMCYKKEATSEYAKQLRNGLTECAGNLVTNNTSIVIKRYSHIPPGGNWKDIPDELMNNYADKSRCHTGIYRRLCADEPSITVGNYRKSMLIHPWEDRGLSVREAARLQSFPDSYRFFGSIGFQQQQVGNAVPPLLAKRVFDAICNK